MTATLSSVSFQRLPVARPETARPDSARSSHTRLEPGTADAASEPAVAEAAEAPGVLAHAAPSAAAEAAARAPAGSGRVIGLAVLAGALAAAMVVLAAREFLPPRPFDDPRLAQLVHQSGEFSEQLQSLTQKFRTLETEGVATAGAAEALSAQLAIQHTELGELTSTVRRVASGYDSDADGRRSGATAALFGVAVVQLRDAIELGRPFDWELVDLRGIAGHDPKLLRELYRLAPLAGDGVATAEQIRQGLQALTQAEAQRSAPGIVQAGLDIFGRAFGPTLAFAPTNANQGGANQAITNPALLQQASLSLDQDDAAGTLHALRALTGDSATAARVLVAAAEKRAVALDATAVLQDAARRRLQTQLRSATAAGTPNAGASVAGAAP